MRTIGWVKTESRPAAGRPATKDLLESIGRYIDEVRSAGVLLTADETQPSSRGTCSNIFELM